jgi:hypothetical protein
MLNNIEKYFSLILKAINSGFDDNRKQSVGEAALLLLPLHWVVRLGQKQMCRLSVGNKIFEGGFKKLCQARKPACRQTVFVSPNCNNEKQKELCIFRSLLKNVSKQKLIVSAQKLLPKKELLPVVMCRAAQKFLVGVAVIVKPCTVSTCL